MIGRVLMRLVLVVSALSMFSSAVMGQRDLGFEMPGRGICAHRGASTTHPENTVAALKEAIRLGVHMIEFDVALTKDKKLVLMHDSTLDRTTNGSGAVSDFTLAQLKELDAGSFKGEQFKDIRIPTLQEALDLMPENIWLNVHLKGGEELAIESAKVIANNDRLHQCFLACGASAAAAARKESAGIQICNMERQGNSLTYVNESIEFGAEFLQLFGGASVLPSNVKRAIENGIRVNFCCTNEVNVLKHLFESGVQFPLVDDAAAMMKAAEQFGIEKLRPIYRSRISSLELTRPLSTLIDRVTLAKGNATQGIAVGESGYFASNAGNIVRFNSDWEFQEEKSIRLPGVNHIGAIHLHEGVIWAGFLNGPENGKYDPELNKAVVAKIDAKSLDVIDSWDITVDVDWIDPVCFDGKYLWVGDLSDLGIHRYRFEEGKIVRAGVFRYPGDMHFSQGIRVVENRLYSIHTFGSMDGLFEFVIPDELSENVVKPVKVWRIPEDYSHAEGFDFVPGKHDEIWHAQYKHIDRIKLTK